MYKVYAINFTFLQIHVNFTLFHFMSLHVMVSCLLIVANNNDLNPINSI